jgi:hypothetical protein
MSAKSQFFCGNAAISVTKPAFRTFFTDYFQKTGVHFANVTTSPDGKEL